MDPKIVLLMSFSSLWRFVFSWDYMQMMPKSMSKCSANNQIPLTGKNEWKHDVVVAKRSFDDFTGNPTVKYNNVRMWPSLVK
jgi:hypothetical protein